MQITSRAPTRIDLAGGTLDLWPLYLLHEEAITVNAAINLYANVKIETLPGSRIDLVSRDQNVGETAENCASLPVGGSLKLLARLVRYFAPEGGIRLETESMAPAGSGLGGSSTLAIAVAGALNRLTARGHSPEELIGVTRDIEAQVLGIPTGEQDYYAAMYGGCNAWHFRIQSVQREACSVPLLQLQERLLLFYSGLPRNSGINNWQVYKNRVDGDSRTTASLQKIREQSGRLNEALKRQDWNEVYSAVSEEWEARKQMAPGITSPEIEAILSFGLQNGARAGKVCGAGGGGCLFLLADPDIRTRIAALAREKQLPLLEFNLVSEGLAVE